MRPSRIVVLLAGTFSAIVFAANLWVLLSPPPLDDFLLRELQKQEQALMEERREENRREESKRCDCSKVLEEAEMKKVRELQRSGKEEKEEEAKKKAKEEDKEESASSSSSSSTTTEKSSDKGKKKSCQPTTKVAFAKTHKTGSSTVQNILLRFGAKHDLNFALPPNSWMFKLNVEFDADLVLEGPWKPLEFDIFAFHCLWNYEEVGKIIPRAKFITILREPLSLFESGYVYFGLQKVRGIDINGFAEKFAAKGEKRHKFAFIGQNNLLADLGMEAEQVDNMTAVKRTIKDVEEKFEVVLIMERFEESLVHLADAFCWPLEDVAYLKQNERLGELRTVPTDKTKEIMKVWLRGDYELYNHFMEVMDRKTEAYGKERMSRDVARLRAMNARLKSECVSYEKPREDRPKAGLFAVYRMEEDFSKPWCAPYTRRETEYCKIIRGRQSVKVDRMVLGGAGGAKKKFFDFAADGDGGDDGDAGGDGGNKDDKEPSQKA